MADPGPQADRPLLPDGYGAPETLEGLLAWPAVERRLIEARSYWLSTTRGDGRPHVVPRWGVWVGGRFFYDGSPATLHARNVARNPACVLHLEDGTQAVIVEGSSSAADPPAPDLGRHLSEAFAAKYAELGYRPEPDAWAGADAGGLMMLTPSKVLAWFDFPNDVTRFRFAG